MKVEIQRLLGKIEAGTIGKSQPWQGADVVIVEVTPEPTVGGFHPDQRFVETENVAELSWAFEQLRDIFWKCEGYGLWKEEFFGRLGNVATKFQSVCPEGSLTGLLSAVIEEASTMADEIELKGGLEYLALTFDNRIFDDFNLVSDGNRYLNQALVEKRLEEYANELPENHIKAWGVAASVSPRDNEEDEPF